MKITNAVDDDDVDGGGDVDDDDDDKCWSKYSDSWVLKHRLESHPCHLFIVWL